MGIIDLDVSLLLGLQDTFVRQYPVLDEIFLLIANYSSMFFALVVGTFILYYIVSKRLDGLKQGILLSIAIFIPIAISYIARIIIARPRPFLVSDYEPLLTHYGSNSFPSNHATAAFAIATGVYVYNKKAGMVLIVTAFLTAFSRVFVGVHYPLDVITGGAVGILSVIGATTLFRQLNENRGLKYKIK